MAMKKVKKRSKESEEQSSSSIDRRYIWLGGLGIAFLVAIILLIFLTRPQAVDPTIYDDLEAGSRVLGDPNAPLLVRDFSDFKCPHCRQASTSVVPRLIEEYVSTGQIRLELVPVGFRDESLFAGQAALCAEDQGKFWPYHDILFENQENRFTIEQLLQYGRDLSMDDQLFRDCILSGKYRGQLEENGNEFRAVGGTGTPTFVVGDQTISSGVPSFETLESAISQQLQ